MMQTQNLRLIATQHIYAIKLSNISICLLSIQVVLIVIVAMLSRASSANNDYHNNNNSNDNKLDDDNSSMILILIAALELERTTIGHQPYQAVWEISSRLNFHLLNSNKNNSKLCKLQIAMASVGVKLICCLLVAVVVAMIVVVVRDEEENKYKYKFYWPTSVCVCSSDPTSFMQTTWTNLFVCSFNLHYSLISLCRIRLS